FTFQAGWEPLAAPTNKTRTVVIKGQQTAADVIPVDKAEFFPEANNAFEVASATEKVPDAAGFALRKVVTLFSGDWPKEISGLMVIEGNHQRRGFNVTMPVGPTAPATKTTSAATSGAVKMDAGAPAPPTGKAPVSLGMMLLYAFIGGLILNIMPCVLPVIALKILGFVSEARSEPRRVRNLGFIYALGVLVSFLAFAGIIIGVKAAGHHAGWGMQFGSPIFVVCLTTLVTLVALNLFGVFEVVIGGRALNAAGELAGRHGASGAFFNGLLATILATPCTAPFLVDALGFAFSQTAPVIVLIFLTIGLGLAAPYVVLSCNPALLKFLPKPGAWMEKFKIAMGFPMLATVVWLFCVAAADYGPRVLWLGVFLVITAFAAWIFGEFFQRGRTRKGAALATALILLIGGYAYALEGHLHWREMISETDAAVKPSDKTSWQPWSPEAVAAARAEGKIVVVDFTAAWCVTCNAIVKPALESEAVAARRKELNAVVLLADYTRTPQAITEEISKYGGAGVPLVLVYPKSSDGPPMVLPQPSPLQLSSSYGKIILDALGQAAK
ncbi:MAG TPA: thioredoxin family protein, partial [Candidatus Acidoferrales bacterium]|nr:thioredoxin family protein [Candidatus Acidoferrales bacterium]